MSSIPTPAPAGKRRKLPTEEEASELTGMLSDPPKHTFDSLPDSHTDEAVQAWVEQFKRQFKGKQQDFKTHLATAQQALKRQHSRAELVQCVKEFGLPNTLAIRMNIKNLTTLIAALQFEAA